MQVLSQVKAETEKNLAEFFRVKKKTAGEIDGFCPEIVGQIEDLTLRGGKRTRAFLVWCGFNGYAATNLPRITRNEGKAGHQPPTTKPLTSLMLAMELFQSFALIQDDIMDEDEERRGGVTVHKYFEEQYKRINKDALRQAACAGRAQGLKTISNPSTALRKENVSRYGESMAMLAGDMALTWADELFYQCMLNPLPGSPSAALREDLMNIYRQMKEEVLYGQSLDIANSYEIKNIPQNKIDELKTAWYSVIRPLQLGACLTGADRKQLKKIAAYGLPAGLAYQAKDDRMDGEISNEELAKKRNVLVKKARQALDGLNMRKEYKMLLDDFAEFVIKRES